MCLRIWTFPDFLQIMSTFSSGCFFVRHFRLTSRLFSCIKPIYTGSMILERTLSTLTTWTISDLRIWFFNRMFLLIDSNIAPFPHGKNYISFCDFINILPSKSKTGKLVEVTKTKFDSKPPKKLLDLKKLKVLSWVDEEVIITSLHF